MSAGSSSSYIHDGDQSRRAFNSLFAFPSNPRTWKPYSKRNLPDSFYRPPNASTKSKHIQRQHARSHSNSSDTNISPHTHTRATSDTGVLTEQSMKNSGLAQINSQSTLLPLPDDWEEKQTPAGEFYYIDHRTQSTTWTDPRPKHYAAFQAFCLTLPLPDGFEQTWDAKGNSYFLDHQTKQTYWDDPRPSHYRSLMTKRLTAPASTSEGTLSDRLVEIAKERHALQIRTQELQKLEEDIRKRIDQRNQTEFDSLIDDLLVLKRQDSTDSGLDDTTHPGRCNANQRNDFLDQFGLPDTSNYDQFPVLNEPMSQNMSNDHQIDTTDF